MYCTSFTLFILHTHPSSSVHPGEGSSCDGVARGFLNILNTPFTYLVIKINVVCVSVNISNVHVLLLTVHALSI